MSEEEDDSLCCPSCKGDLESLDLQVGIHDLFSLDDSKEEWGCPYCQQNLSIEMKTTYIIEEI